MLKLVRWIPLITAAGVTGLAADGKPAATTTPDLSTPRQAVSAAPDQDANDERDLFVRLHGSTIRGVLGENLGEIADLVVDVAAGDIPYVVVASTTAPGVGYRLRLVPTGAMKRMQDQKSFQVPFEAAKWRNLESIDAAELKSGALTAFQAQREEIASRYGFLQPGAERARLLLATQLRGRTLRNGHETLGRVEGILAAPDQRMAMALVRSGNKGEVQTFLVPLVRLQLSSVRADHFTTTLTRRDLEAGHAVHIDLTAALSAVSELERIVGASVLSQSSVSGQRGYASAGTAPNAGPGITITPGHPAAAPAADRHPDGALTPTGPSQTEVNAERMEAALAAVRQAVAADRSLPAAQIQVEVSHGRLLLTGEVRSADIRRRVEERAKQSAPAAEIENRIFVRP